MKSLSHGHRGENEEAAGDQSFYMVEVRKLVPSRVKVS